MPRTRAWSTPSASLDSLHLKASTSPATSSLWEGCDVVSPLIDKKSSAAKSIWLDDSADIFVLLCSLLLTAASIVFIALVFHTQGSWDLPRKALSIFQRLISSLSVTITSAVIMVAAKRYLLFRLVRGGLRSRRVAAYSNPSIGGFLSYLALHKTELPLLGFLAVWALGLTTSLTVDDSWKLEPSSSWHAVGVPFGPLDPILQNSSWVTPATEQLYSVFLSSWQCFGTPAFGAIKVTSSLSKTGYPLGTIYYPPLPYTWQDSGFSFMTTMNGFDVSMEQLSSVPSTARPLTCASSVSDIPINLWADGSDNHMLSIVATYPSVSPSVFRLNAAAITMHGTLSSDGNNTEFVLNGTSWPITMSEDSQWAQDITSLICNTTFPSFNDCPGSTLLDFAIALNDDLHPHDEGSLYAQWSTALSMAIGAYSSVMYPHIGNSIVVPVTQYGVTCRPQYGIYILMFHAIVSLVMLVIIVRLRLASHLGADFLHSTRLLVDPLKKPELFNASLERTLDALGNPYMAVREDNQFLIVKQEREKRGGWISLGNLSR